MKSSFFNKKLNHPGWIMIKFFAIALSSLVIFVNGISWAISAPRHYEKIITELRSVHLQHPQHTKIFSLGQNDFQETIYGIKVFSNTENHSLKKTNHLIVASHHGNEVHSTYLSLVFIQDLLKILLNPKHSLYKKFSTKNFYIIPVLNIGGFNTIERMEINKVGIKVDSNRDYPDPCTNNSFFTLRSTYHLAQFLKTKQIVSAITIHGYWSSMTYPWGVFSNQSTPHQHDHNIFHKLVSEASFYNRYETGTHANVIYASTGSFEDYAYHEFGIWAVLLEVHHNPNLKRDSQSLISFFTHVPNERSKKHRHPKESCFIGRSGHKGLKGRP